MGTRDIRAESAAEEAVIGHLRGWCHNSAECGICAAERAAREAGQRLESVIAG